MYEKIAPIATNDRWYFLLKGKAAQAKDYTKLKPRVVTAERKWAVLCEL